MMSVQHSLLLFTFLACLLGASSFLQVPSYRYGRGKLRGNGPDVSSTSTSTPSTRGRLSLLAAQQDDVLQDTPASFETGDNAPPRLAYLALWVGLATYAFTISPGGSVEAGAIDADIIKTMIGTPFAEGNTISPIFTAIFNMLGVLPAIYASLLLPATKLKQKVPGLPFVLSSFALGFFGVGPYLGLRNRRENVLDSERGRGTALFEFKLTSLAMLGFAAYLAYFGISGVYAGSDRLADFLQLFSTQRLAHISTIDFTILSLALQDPLSEDMKRRGWSGPSAPVFCALPVLGPCVYLLLRPSLPKE